MINKITIIHLGKDSPVLNAHTLIAVIKLKTAIPKISKNSGRMNFTIFLMSG